MIEVVGDTGYKANPEQVDSTFACMVDIYFNREERNKKAAAALRKSFDFSWYKTVSETLQVYEEAYRQYKRNVKQQTTHIHI